MPEDNIITGLPVTDAFGIFVPDETGCVKDDRQSGYSHLIQNQALPPIVFQNEPITSIGSEVFVRQLGSGNYMANINSVARLDGNAQRLFLTYYPIEKIYEIADSQNLLLTWDHAGNNLFFAPRLFDAATGGPSNRQRWKFKRATIGNSPKLVEQSKVENLPAIPSEGIAKIDSSKHERVKKKK